VFQVNVKYTTKLSHVYKYTNMIDMADVVL